MTYIFDVEENIEEILSKLSVSPNSKYDHTNFNLYLNHVNINFQTGVTSSDFHNKRIIRTSFNPYNDDNGKSMHYNSENNELKIINHERKGLATAFDIKYVEKMIELFNLDLYENQIAHDHKPYNKRLSQLKNIGIHFTKKKGSLVYPIGLYYAKFLKFANEKKGIQIDENQKYVIKQFIPVRKDYLLPKAP